MSSFGRKLKLRRKKKETPELSITSLLDILTVLLMFLIRSYNTTDLSLEVIPGINLPTSSSNDLGSHAVTVQVNKNRELFFNNKLLTQLDAAGNGAQKLEQLLAKEAENERQALARMPASLNKTLLDKDGKPHPIPLKINFFIFSAAAMKLLNFLRLSFLWPCFWGVSIGGL